MARAPGRDERRGADRESDAPGDDVEAMMHGREARPRRRPSPVLAQFGYFIALDSLYRLPTLPYFW